MESPYYVNEEVKQKIDLILHRTVEMMANLGTKSKLDVGSLTKAKQLEKEWLQEVEKLDKEMYQSLVPQGAEVK